MEYHLAPEFKYPHQLHEVEAVLNWLHRNGRARGVDPTRICIGRLHTHILGITHARTRGGVHEQMRHCCACCLQICVYPSKLNLMQDTRPTQIEHMSSNDCCDISFCITMQQMAFSKLLSSLPPSWSLCLLSLCLSPYSCHACCTVLMCTC